LIAKRAALRPQWGALDHCIRLLIAAGETDIEAATEQVGIVLRGRRLL
jgi:hypothetical protein